MSIKRAFFFIALFSTLLACAIPSFSATPTPAAKPTADRRLDIMVAETVAAAIAQTAQALPPTSTPTLTPEATSTPMNTPTPSALPPVGSSLTQQDGGSTLFTDQRAGYTILVPENWLAVRVNEQEFIDALTLAESADPLLHETLSAVASEDPNVLRLFAVDVKDASAQGEPISSIKWIWDDKKTISFASDADIQTLADELPKTINGLKVTAVDILLAPRGMQFGVIESEIIGSDGAQTFQKRVFFNAKVGSVQALLTTGKSLKVNIIPAFDSMMDTINLLNP